MCVVVVLVFLGGREQSAPLCGGFSRHSVCDGEFPVPGPNPQASGKEGQGQAPPGAEAEQLHLTPPTPPPPSGFSSGPLSPRNRVFTSLRWAQRLVHSRIPHTGNPRVGFYTSTGYRRTNDAFVSELRDLRDSMWLLLKRLELHPLLPTTKFFKSETERTAAPLTFRQSALV